MNSGNCRVSVVIPVYNEASLLERCVGLVNAAVGRMTDSYEIIIAEDGSMDGSDRVAEELACGNSSVVHLHSDQRLGKGSALKRALKASRGEIVVFLDADMATRLEHLSELVESIENGNRMAAGSRHVRGSHVRRPLLRAIASLAYNLVVRLLFRDGVFDHQCGLKAFSRRMLESTIDDMEDDGFLFDTELIVRARRRGFTMVEIPVEWTEDHERNSKFRLIEDGLRMGFGLLKLRVRLWNGRS